MLVKPLSMQRRAIPEDWSRMQSKTSTKPRSSARSKARPLQFKLPLPEKMTEKVRRRSRGKEQKPDLLAKYHQVIENANEAILIAQEGRIKFFNPKTTEMFGYAREELLSKHFLDFVHPEDRDMVADHHARRLAGENLPHKYPFRIVDGREEVRWVEINATFIGWEGRPATLNFINDITERVRMEEALRQSEEYFRALIEKTLDVTLIIDAQGVFRYASPSVLGVTGHRPENLVGEDVFKFIHPDDASKVREAFERGLRDMISPAKMEFRVFHSDGSYRTVESIGRNLLEVPAVRGYVVNARDITARKSTEEEMQKLQEQLRQAQKMEAIGRLAGGIAHDFNNLLTIIQGYSDLSLLVLRDGDPVKENIHGIERAAKRAAALTQQLLAFSRRQMMEMKIIDLNVLLRDLDKMLHRLIGEDIELVTVLAEDLGMVKVDPGQIEQVVLNLAVNAKDAMPSGGKLTIETLNVELDEAYARAHVAVKPGPFVMFSITDTGEGITPEVKERIFEPFFTTKEVGKGTGLGLSTVYGIVKQCGGNIWVYSEAGQGTTFKLYFPRLQKPGMERGERSRQEDSPHGTETILVVEDEDEVRKLTVDILRNQGYTVLEAAQGQDAIAICEHHSELIHLMLTDVVMPKMNGAELARRLTPLHRDMKVLYMSGYTDHAVFDHGLLKGAEYIQKPFTMVNLSKKVREVLDKK